MKKTEYIVNISAYVLDMYTGIAARHVLCDIINVVALDITNQLKSLYHMPIILLQQN